MATRRPFRIAYPHSIAKTRLSRRRSALRVETLEDRTVPTVYAWAAAASGDFNVPANWTPVGVPSSGDDATIGFSGITVTSATSNTVHSLTNSASLSVNAGTFAVTSGGSNNGTITTAGGTTFDLTGGTFTWSGGTFNGTGTFKTEAAATLALTGTSGKLLDVATLNNLGSITFTGTGNWNVADAASIANVGSLTIATDADIPNVSGIRAVLTNSGSIIKSGSVGFDTGIGAIFNNTGGSITVNSGQLTLTDGTSTGGNYTVAADAALDLTGGATQNYVGTFTGSGTGTVRFSGGAINVGLPGATFNFPGSQLQWTSGTLTGLGGSALTNSGTMNLSGPANKALTNTLLNNPGTINVGGTGLWLAGNTTVTNTGVIDFQGDLGISDGVGITATVNNTGSFRKSGGSGTAHARAIVNNNAGGTIASQSGVLSLDIGGASSGGTFLATGGNSVDLAFNYTFNGGTTTTGAGLLRLVASNLTIAAPVTIQNFGWINGGINGTGALTIANTLEISGGLNKALDGITLTNAGSGTMTGAGTFQFGNGSTFLNNGSLAVQSDAWFAQAFGFGGCSFTNNGTFTKSSTLPTGATQIQNVAFNNTGTVMVASGILQVLFGINSGQFNIATGAGLEFLSGTTSLNAGTTISGNGTVTVSGGTTLVNTAVAIQNLRQTGGAIYGPGSIAIGGSYVWSGGALGTNTTLPAGATLAVAGGNTKYLDGTTLTNAGTAILTGTGEFQLGNGAAVQNSGSFAIQSDAFVRYAFGNPGNFFTNTGTLTKSSTLPTGTTRFQNLAFNNLGTVNVVSGILQTDFGNHSGTFNTAPLAQLQFLFGTSTLNAGTQFTGDGLVSELANAILYNTAPVTIPHLLQNTGTLSGTATLTVSSDFTWQTGLIGSPSTPYVLEIAPTATATVSGVGLKYIDTGTLLNKGAMAFSSVANIQFGNAATLRNEGTLDVQTDADFIYSFGAVGNRIINTGTLIKTADVGTTTIGPNIDLNNTGTIDVASGTLDIAATVTQLVGGTLSAGTWKVDAGAGLILPANVTTNAATVILNGSGSSLPQLGSLTTNSGKLQLAGGRSFALAGPLTNTGTLRLGPQSTLTVNGAFTQTATGTTITEIGGQPASGDFGVLAASGAATLDGTVQVDLVNGFGPTAGGNFTVMTYGSETGNFTFVSPTAPKQGDLFTPIVNPTTLVVQSVVDAADLAVTNIYVPGSAVPGTNVQIGYDVKNLSTSPTVVTDWVDSVYLSKDALLDPSDVLVQRVAHSATLNPGATYNAQTNIALPGLNPGDYHVIVVTDSRSFVPDTNRPNNTMVAPATLAVSVPSVSIGATTSGTITNGQDIYYRVDLPAGKTFKIGATFAVASELEMYVGYKSVPSRTSFDQTTFPVGQTSGSIVLPGTQAGTYYILLHGREGATGGKAFDLKVEELAFQVVSVDNGRGSNLGTATATIHGAGFTATTNVQLVLGPMATKVQFKDSTTLFATFDLTGLAAGDYNVKVTDGASISTLPAAFTVTTGVPGILVTHLTVPTAMRALGKTTITIDYANEGETDIPAPILYVDANDVGLKLPQQTEYYTGFAAVIGINPNGPAGILPAGFHGTITLDVLSLSPIPHNTITFNLSTADGPLLPIDWAATKAGMRPASIPVDAWDAVFANFVARVGPTHQSYQQRLADDATYLSSLGVVTNDYSRLVQYELNQANAALTGASLSTAVDAVMPAPGIPLQFVRAYNATITGHYNIGRLGRGWTDNWDFTAAADPQGNATLNYGGTDRFFVRNDNGSYTGTPGDRGVLTFTAGKFAVTEVDGTTTGFLANGKLDFIGDANGNRVTAGYDVQGRLATLTHSNGATLTLAYNGFDRISSVTDSAGRVATYTYDGIGEHLATYADVHGAVDYTYASGQGAGREHALTRITLADGAQANFVYDAQGRLQTRSLNAGIAPLNYTYGSAGGYTIADAASGATTFDIDDQSLVRRTTDPLGHITLTNYDASRRPTVQTQADGTTYSYAYDAAGNLIAATDPLGHATGYNYDAANQLTAYADPTGNTTAYQYDAHRNPTRVTYADGAFATFAYDPQGNVTTWTNARGQALQYTYNAAGQVTHEAFADSSSIDYSYDARGRLFSATDATGTYTLTYNGLDQLTNLATPGGKALAFTYDAVGRRATMTDQTGFQVKYHYDAAGRLDTVRDGTNAVLAAYTYDAAGRLSREDKGNGTFTTTSYDLAGNVLSLVNRADVSTINSSFAYTYDALNRAASETTGGITTAYGYDLTGQLTSVTRPGRTLLYTYDAAGNRKTASDNGVPTTFTANSRNEITASGADTFGYDADGNRITQTVGGVMTNFTFRQDNRLVGIATPSAGDADSFIYDPFGQRVSATHNATTTNFLVDPAGLGSVVSEYSGAGTLTAHYTQGFGLLSRVDAGGVAAYYEFDRIGNTAGLTDATHADVNSYTYLPFGETTAGSTAVANPYTFGGRFGVSADPVGTFNMRARDYDVATGQFLSDDPLGLNAGDANIRRFVGNDPVSFTDPTGLDYAGEGGTDSDGKPLYYPMAYPLCLIDPLAMRNLSRSPREACYGYTLKPSETATYPGKPQPVKPKTPENPSSFPKTPTKPPAKPPGGSGTGTPGLPPAPLPPKPPAPPPPHNQPPGRTDPLTPNDPNDLIGPAGFGAAGFVPADASLPFTIRYQNQPTASAPAVVVTVTQILDADLDLDTFQLTGFGFGPYRVDVPAGRDNFATRIDALATRGLFVDVTVNLDRTTRLLTVVFTSIDPVTLDQPADVDAGFLPPDNAASDGQGYISYIVRAKAGKPSGTAIDGQATIVFDNLAGIPTNVTLNTIDAGNPVASVTELPDVEPTMTFPVSWTGVDDTNGSGVGTFDVYVSDNGGPWTIWQSQTAATTAMFTALPSQEYHTFDFYAVATDHVGNAEPNVPAIETSTVATQGAYARADVYGVDANKKLSATAKTGLLANDPKKAGKTYTVDIPSIVGPTHGTLLPKADGSFTYMPDGTFTGLDSFTYRSKDSDGVFGNVATVTLATQIVSFKSTKVTAPEAKPSASVVIQLRKPATADTTVNYVLTGSTATAVNDFDAASGSVTFHVGEKSKTILIPIVNDTIDEADETFKVVLKNTTLGVLSALPAATVTIKDNDAPPTVGFTAVSSPVAEGVVGGTVTIAVSLSAASEKTVTVAFAIPAGTAGGTAKGGGTDYTLVSGPLTFAPGETVKYITLTIVQDAVHEANETVIVKLGKATNAKVVKPVHTLTITDDDP